MIDDVRTFSGPYYECSVKVLSEACIPILDVTLSRTLGIIDAESWSANYFDNARQLQLLKVCFDLAKYL
jgi:putative methionine-R-sulfoxide reductase with GAF domain